MAQGSAHRRSLLSPSLSSRLPSFLPPLRTYCVLRVRPSCIVKVLASEWWRQVHRLPCDPAGPGSALWATELTATSAAGFTLGLLQW